MSFSSIILHSFLQTNSVFLALLQHLKQLIKPGFDEVLKNKVYNDDAEIANQLLISFDTKLLKWNWDSITKNMDMDLDIDIVNKAHKFNINPNFGIPVYSIRNRSSSRSYLDILYLTTSMPSISISITFQLQSTDAVLRKNSLWEGLIMSC